MDHFAVDLAIQLAQLLLSFYGFWLVWQVLLPVLPGPRQATDRIAPFAGYFIDPLRAPLTTRLRLPPWIASLILLITDAAALVALTHLT
jgi:hypothetical protein